MSIRPATPVSAPGRSNLTHHLGLGAVLVADGRLLSAGTMKKLSMLMSAQVIARAQKDHCHRPFSAQSDETAEPVTIPTGPMPPKHEMEKLRLRPMGNVRPMRAIPLGTIKAGPMPCIARPATSMVYPRYSLNPQNIDQTANQSQPKMKMRLWPNMSPSRPAGSMRVPKAIP